jgi:prepilin-type N-terminal cleavage/methylation domain-containing protein
MRQRTRHARRGFSLVEVAITIVIVGLSTVALMQLLAVGTNINGQAYDLTNGLNLANNVRERYQQTETTAALSLNGTTFSPPIDARGKAISDMSTWSQRISVTKVDVDNLSLAVPSGTAVPTARFTVAVTQNGTEVCRIAWLTVDTK